MDTTTNAPQRSRRSFACLGSFIWRNKGIFFFCDFLRVLSSAAIAVHPYFLGQFATSVDDKERAFTFLMLFLVSGMIHGVIWNGADFIVARRIFPLMYEFKKIAFRVFWSKNYTTFIEKPSGKVGYYINQFPHKLYGLYDSYHYGFLPVVVSIPIYAYLLSTLSWQSVVIYLVFISLIMAILTFVARFIEKHQRVYVDSDSSNSGRVFDSYANFVNVFSFRAQHKEIKRTSDDIDDVIKLAKTADTVMMTYWSTASFMIRFGLWSAIIFFSWYMYDSGRVSFSALVVSVAVLADFTHIFWNVVHQLGNWKKNSASFRESYEYLFGEENMIHLDEKLTREKSSDDDIVFNESLEIVNLSFAYPDSPQEQVLKDIRLRVAKNEKIGIVGKSGSGKSTLVKILLGFYNIDDAKNSQGHIEVDGKVIHSDQLSQLYAYVPQDTTLFQESIFYNIAYAKQGEATLDEVKEAARKAHISEFIETLPEGYDTLVGERGVKLSLGQRQRIAIARAFLKESPLLILDEATSSLDSETESYVQESFEDLWGNKSVIAIAHRLSTLNNVDRIVVMSKGKIVEQGTKEELLALSGYFADLWNHQKKGMI
jgi:ATP-binding cassette subfamily B protein